VTFGYFPEFPMNTRANSPQASPAPGLPGGVPRKWLWHYGALLRLREFLKSDELSKYSEVAAPPASPGTDFAEKGADEIDHQAAIKRLAADESAVREVVAALDRILNGTYGICEVTGSPIPPERLRAVPWCRHLREVEEQIEKAAAAAPSSGASRRPRSGATPAS
jgi:RNA polymerase-binding transcription factor DksA